MLGWMIALCCGMDNPEKPLKPEKPEKPLKPETSFSQLSTMQLSFENLNINLKNQKKFTDLEDKINQWLDQQNVKQTDPEEKKEKYFAKQKTVPLNTETLDKKINCLKRRNTEPIGSKNSSN